MPCPPARRRSTLVGSGAAWEDVARPARCLQGWPRHSEVWKGQPERGAAPSLVIPSRCSGRGSRSCGCRLNGGIRIHDREASGGLSRGLPACRRTVRLRGGIERRHCPPGISPTPARRAVSSVSLAPKGTTGPSTMESGRASEIAVNFFRI